MKRCPRCDKTYPDSEAFCETDGTALVPAAPAFVEQGAGEHRGAVSGNGGVECPVCGGKAEPGELICNFCGARLPQQPEAAPDTFEFESPTAPVTPARQAVTRVHRSTGDISPQEPPPRQRGALALISYVAAAAIALAAGVWFALYLGSHKAQEQTVAKVLPSAAASPAPLAPGPLVALANRLPVQVLGNAATVSERNADAMRKVFENNKHTLLDAYDRALDAQSTLGDGMLLRIRVMPDGSVEQVGVRTSTSPNPGLDADVVNSMLRWKFGPVVGAPVDVEFPVIFAPSPSREAQIESQLSKRIASLSPNESPEYASAPPPPASATPKVAAVAPSATPKVAVVAPPPVVTPPAVVAPRASVAPPRRAAAAKRRRTKLASIAKPAPSLFQRVQERLRANRKMNRVRFYTAGGTVTLYGRVFDDNDKRLAERIVRNVPGVTNVVDTLSTDTAQWVAQQNRIMRQLQNAGLNKVTVKVIGRDAYLNGEVKTALEKQRAVTIAEGAAPVTVRENLIRVTPGNVFGF